ncbi:glycosyltransferase family 25 protein [Agrobacterium larrymoorei]|uniref:glycosyltransferase family 25 protein n=1 Tax=Agrobacterium larrymoorei TaxID=160699 RepID=UPI0030BAB4B8
MHIFENSNSILAVYLINMANAQERKHAMFDKLSAIGLTAERVEAVDGRALTFPIPEFSELSYKLMHGRRTCPPEIGCYLSHVECARRLLNSDADFALILEDDVVFKQDFMESIEAAIDHRNDWDILRLSTVSHGRKYPFRKLTGDRSLSVALTREKGSGAYIVNRKAAKWIAEKLVPMRLAYDIAYDLEYLAGLKSAFIYPLCASQDADNTSSIQGTARAYKLPRWRYFTVLPFRAYLEVTRFLFRGARLLVGYAGNLSAPRKAAAEKRPNTPPVSSTPLSLIANETATTHAFVSPGVNPIK